MTEPTPPVPLPEVVDVRPSRVAIGGTPVEYFAHPGATRSMQFNPLATDRMLAEAALQTIAVCLTREDALIRECLELRATIADLKTRIAALETKPVELDMAALSKPSSCPHPASAARFVPDQGYVECTACGVRIAQHDEG